jgi:hypothetical protein
MYGRWHQTGHGFYISKLIFIYESLPTYYAELIIQIANEPTSWAETLWSRSKYCVIEADSEMMEKFSKIWIPKEYSVKGSKTKPKLFWNFWEDNEDDIIEYIRSMGVPDPEKALRFSHIPSKPGMLQMDIPTDTINDLDLDFGAQCWDTKEELMKYSDEKVDWTKWKIAGDSSIPLEPSGSSNQEGKASWYRWW